MAVLTVITAAKWGPPLGRTEKKMARYIRVCHCGTKSSRNRLRNRHWYRYPVPLGALIKVGKTVWCEIAPTGGAAFFSSGASKPEETEKNGGNTIIALSIYS